MRLADYRAAIAAQTGYADPAPLRAAIFARLRRTYGRRAVRRRARLIQRILDNAEREVWQ